MSQSPINSSVPKHFSKSKFKSSFLGSSAFHDDEEGTTYIDNTSCSAADDFQKHVVDEESVRVAVQEIISSEAINFDTKIWFSLICQTLGIVYDNENKELLKSLNTRSIILSEAEKFKSNSVNEFSEFENSIKNYDSTENEVIANEYENSTKNGSTENEIVANECEDPNSSEIVAKECESSILLSGRNNNMKSTDDIEKEGGADELQETKVIEKALSERELAVAELLNSYLLRDKDMLREEAEAIKQELRNKINSKFKKCVNSSLQSDGLQLKKIKNALQKRGLPDEFEDESVGDAEELSSSIHSIKKNNLAPSIAENDSCNILLSDDDDGDDDEVEDGDGVADKPTQQTENDIAKYHRESVNQSESKYAMVGGNTSTYSLTGGRSQRAMLRCKYKRQSVEKSTSQRAKDIGLENADAWFDVLEGRELKRRCVDAKRQLAEMEKKDEERSRKLLAEQKYLEDLENAADASEEEFDEDDEKYVAVPRRSSEDEDITNLNSSDPAYVEVSDLDDEEDNEFNEEEELSRLIDEERREMECSLKAESLKDSTSRPTETECGLIENISIALSQHASGECDLHENEDTLLSQDHEEPHIETDITLESNIDQKQVIDTSLNNKLPMKVKKSKSSSYRAAVEMEERVLSQAKKSGQALFDDEAEEEEETGKQAGLGDFGFIIPRNENDEEKEALKLRKDDFSNIVDELSDNEGDEELGEQKRAEEEVRRDKENIKKTLENVANGWTGKSGGSNENSAVRGHFGIHGLLSDDTENKDKNGIDEEEDDDDEQMYLNKQKQRFINANAESASTDEQTDEDSDEDVDSDMLGEEEKDLINMQKKADKEYRKRIMEKAKKNSFLRDLRRNPTQGIAFIAPIDLSTTIASVTSNASTIYHDDESIMDKSNFRNDNSAESQHVSLPTQEISFKKRRTSRIPQKLAPCDDIRPRSKPKDAVVSIPILGRSVSMNRNIEKRGELSGVLNKSHIDNGYGMGMAVSLNRRKSSAQVDNSMEIRRFNSESSANVSTSFFSAVTGKHSSSDILTTKSTFASSLAPNESNDSHTRRTYSNVISKRVLSSSRNAVGFCGVSAVNESFVFSASHDCNDSQTKDSWTNQTATIDDSNSKYRNGRDTSFEGNKRLKFTNMKDRAESHPLYNFVKNRAENISTSIRVLDKL